MEPAAPTRSHLRSTPLRSLGVLVVGVGAALSFAGCGDTSSDTSEALEPIQPSSYVVKEPATTTTTIAPAEDAEPGSISETEQEYVVQAGDALALIANRYDVDITELANYNEWPEGINHPLFPGDVVRIPPGASVPQVATAGDDEEGDLDAPSDSETATGSTVAPNDDNQCEPGTYTIEEGDTSRFGVAEKFDITVEAMDAANAGTPGYSSFYPGLEIVIPAGDDC